MEFLLELGSGLVVGIVIVLSVVPIGVEWWRAQVRARRESVPADR